MDYAQSMGVIHHTSDPAAVLAEIERVLKPGRAGMRDGLQPRRASRFHLYTAYERMVRDAAFPGLNEEEAFARNTDGADCPISRCYPAREFIEMCSAAGFEAEFVGGYCPPRAALARAELGRGPCRRAAGRRASGVPAGADLRRCGPADARRLPRRHRRRLPPAQGRSDVAIVPEL